MTYIRSLSRPPIQEALIDFRFNGSSDELDALKRISDSIATSAFTTQPINKLEAQFGPLAENAPSVTGLRSLNSTHEGYSIKDLTGHLIVQLRQNQLTVSHATEYGKWEDLVADAAKYLDLYVAMSGAKSIERIGARFINRLRLPTAGFDEFDKVLELPPVKVGEVSGKVSDFLVRQVIKDVDDGWTANLAIGTSTPDPGEIRNNLIVDVEVIKSCSLAPNLLGIQSELAAARSIKNKLFFGSLKDAALEEYR